MEEEEDWFTSILQESYERSVTLLDVRPETEPRRNHLGDTTLSGPVQSTEGTPCWLRVAITSPDSPDITRGFWDGAELANEIPGIAKPEVLAVRDWTTSKDDEESLVKATLMTRAPSPVGSQELVLRSPVELDDRWFRTMRSSMDALAAWPTERECIRWKKVHRSLLVVCGTRVDSAVQRWTTVHGDMHWCNISAPECCILDWETWGLAPAGFDAATLYCASLLVPEVAARIYEAFRDLLETHDGVVSQLVAAQHLLDGIQYGHNEDIADALHDLIARLVRVGDRSAAAVPAGT